MKHIQLVLLSLTLATLFGCSETVDPVTPTVCFTQEVQPMINGGCAKSGCHDSTTRAAERILITHAEIAGEDDLLEVINAHGTELLMPPSPWKRLTDQQIATITKWVEEGKQNNSCDPLPLPDTSAVTYTEHITPIIDLYCIGCHYTQAAGSGPKLNTYEEVRYETEFGFLLPCVAHEDGYVPMPAGRTQLTQNEVEILRLWMTNGYKR